MGSPNLKVHVLENFSFDGFLGLIIHRPSLLLFFFSTHSVNMGHFFKEVALI